MLWVVLWLPGVSGRVFWCLVKGNAPDLTLAEAWSSAQPELGVIGA